MQRLYVGGLSHSVNERELKERFGKFGEVHDVELRTRKDDDGVPYKTFGYININISEGELKRCMTVLNKAKWKGGTLQIETAKESFLHKLAQERQTDEERRLQKPEVEDKRQKMLDALKSAGVDNFTMKAAVPGTEVPGHKDWVVSKFGRVLPILQLSTKKGNKGRTLKYDPSKYCHNIRKLDNATVDLPSPVSKLTWELQGGDDDISKKRRGEFPPYVPPRLKKKARVIPVANSLPANGFKPETNHIASQRRSGDWLDSDSDEDIRRMVESQSTSNGGAMKDEQQDQLEVVGLDYLVNAKNLLHRDKPADEDDYDSADTDELIASKKPPPPKQKPAPPAAAESGSKAVQKTRMQKRSPSVEEEGLKEEPAVVSKRRKKASTDQPSGGPDKLSSEKQVISGENESSTSLLVANSAESETDEDESDSSDSLSDSDYEAMFSNVTHLEISMADLQRLAEESQQASETSVPSSLDTASSTPTAEPRKPKKGTTPEDILASLLADSSDDEKAKKKGRAPKPPPAFMGTKMLNEASGDVMSQGNEEVESGEEEDGKRIVSKKQKLYCEAKLDPNKTLKSSQPKDEVEEEESEEEGVKKMEVLKTNVTSKSVQSKAQTNMENISSCSSSSSDDDEEDEGVKQMTNPTGRSEVKSSSSDQKHSSLTKVASNKSDPSLDHSNSSSSEEDDDDEETARKEQEIKRRTPLAARAEKELQRKANLRRLAAVQLRQKEAEEHKKLIQGALANLDTPSTRAGKHIVFDDDDDDDEEQEEKMATSKKTLLQESQSEDDDDDTEAKKSKAAEDDKHSGTRLFSSSEDEEEEEDEDDKEDKRFDIKPQFEGAAGQKLMELQSRFGTDERFRLDSRFLEKEEDEEDESEKQTNVNGDAETLEDEKKKNLSILQSVLGSSMDQSCSRKPAAKAKTFRDVSVLHYDPSREEHAAFEAKQEKKESKAERKKKREEAQKLPEVSKDIYFDVSGDLKSVFGFGKDEEARAEEKTSWDQQEDAAGAEDEDNAKLSVDVADESTEMKESGFKFSFFGDDETECAEAVEYKVEKISAAKVSWQQDPRLQDSSSDEEEDGEEDQEEVISTTTTTEAEAPLTKDLFFFYHDDIRLTEGPRWFCRPSQLEEKREEWEERRSTLRQEYRKKHKDAKRQLKITKRR